MKDHKEVRHNGWLSRENPMPLEEFISLLRAKTHGWIEPTVSGAYGYGEYELFGLLPMTAEEKEAASNKRAAALARAQKRKQNKIDKEIAELKKLLEKYPEAKI